MKKVNKLRKFGVVSLGAVLLALSGWYAQQNYPVKAMSEGNNVVSAKNSTTNERNSLFADNRPKFGSFGSMNEIEEIPGLNTGTLLYQASWINVSEIISKTSDEIISDLNSLLKLEVLYINSTQLTRLPQVIDVSALKEDSIGNVNVIVEFELRGTAYKVNVPILVVPNKIFEGDDGTGWQHIEKDSAQGVLVSQLNGAKIGFPKRGVQPSGLNEEIKTDTGFVVVDRYDKGYIFGATRKGVGNGRVSSIPYINNELVYPVDEDPKVVTRDEGLGWDTVDNNHITRKYFLRKGNHLKEFLVDDSNKLIYVYDLTISKNLNFSIRLSMYNLSETTKKFSMLESTDTDYYQDEVPIYALEENSGFYFKPGTGYTPENKEMRFAVKLKRNGNWLSEYRRYKVIDFQTIFSNHFGTDFATPGQEGLNLQPGSELIPQGTDTAFQLGAPPKTVKPGEALEVGYEMFIGNELSYMALSATPEEFDVYNQNDKRLDLEYNLASIPNQIEHEDDPPFEVGKGTIYVTYPDDKEDEKIPFVDQKNGTSKGKFSIGLDRLPNETVGSIEEYNINLLAVIEGASNNVLNGLPSNDSGVKVNVYNFGGTPVLQQVLQNSAWKKEAKELIINPAVLPGHTIKYEYEGKMSVDTSKLGLQFVDVRMTDQMDDTQTKVIRVPVLVEKGPLSKGLWMSANDLYIDKSKVSGMTNAQIKEFILNESDARGYDLSTGTNDGVQLEVTSTTFTGRPDVSISHSATIQASKSGLTSKEKKINIFLVEDPEIEATLAADKMDVGLGKPVKYTATFQDKPSEKHKPSKLLAVEFETAPFEKYVTPDKNSVTVQMDGVETKIPSESIEFTKDRTLKLVIPEVAAGAKVTVIYNGDTSKSTPPPAYPYTIDQMYFISCKRADGISFNKKIPSNSQSFRIIKGTSSIEINYLMDDGAENSPIPNDFPKIGEGDDGTDTPLINFNINNYILTKVEINGKSEELLPTKPFTVKYGQVKTITFYYTGVLKIKSAPTSYDFDIKASKLDDIKIANPTIKGDPLVITDTRSEKQTWQLKAKVTEPLQSLKNPSVIIPTAIKYKNETEEISLNDVDNTFFSEKNTEEEYNVTKTRWTQGEGFMLDIPAGAIKSLGKYKAEILITLENAK